LNVSQDLRLKAAADLLQHINEPGWFVGPSGDLIRDDLGIKRGNHADGACGTAALSNTIARFRQRYQSRAGGTQPNRTYRSQVALPDLREIHSLMEKGELNETA